MTGTATMNRPTRRAAAAGRPPQQSAVAGAAALADAGDQLVRRAWTRVRVTLRRPRQPHERWTLAGEVAAAVATLRADLQELYARRLEKVARWAHDSAAAIVAQAVPVAVTEARGLPRPTRPVGTARAVQFDGLTRADRAAIADVGLERMTQREAFGVVYGGDWQARLAAQTRLADPAEIARLVHRGQVAGKTVEQIADDLLPVLNGVRVSARRVAHDEVMWVSHKSQQAAWRQVDDQIIGYRVHSVLDSRVRPKHLERDGWAFYKTPGPGQRGMDERPDPPRESPKDGGVWAYNCRCFLSPIFAKDAELPSTAVAK
jgi:uncharacterized protein with gpF-like domain